MRDRRDEQSKPERRQQVDKLIAEQQPEAAAQRDLEPEHDDDEHDEDVDQADERRTAGACRRSARSRPSGVTFSCSSVPISRSRTMAIDERFDVTTSSSSAKMPGSMK